MGEAGRVWVRQGGRVCEAVWVKAGVLDTRLTLCSSISRGDDLTSASDPTRLVSLSGQWVWNVVWVEANTQAYPAITPPTK